jgi:glycosyltransferase involved in cell wall biosynthesis
MIQVLLATGLYPPEIGGPATYTKLLEQTLPPYGYKVSVLPFSTSRHLPKVVRHMHYFFHLFLRARSVDIVFAQDTVSVGLPALLVCKLLRKPFIVRVPGDYAWEQAVQRFGVTDTIDEFQLRRQPWQVKLLQSIQQQVVCRANTVITPSEYFSTLVAGWGVVPKNIATIYNGVDLDIVPAKVAKPVGKTIVTAGRLVAWKGIGELIDMLSDFSDWNLVVIGDGPLRAQLEQQTVDMGVSDRVTFTGAIARTEVFGWCVAADAFVLNTQFESFSYQVVEAMHSGTPVIVTNVGSLPELISHTVEGVLVEPNDLTAIKQSVRETVSDPDLWQVRTDNAQEKALQFSINACMEKLDVHLQKLV